LGPALLAGGAALEAGTLLLTLGNEGDVPNRPEPKVSMQRKLLSASMKHVSLDAHAGEHSMRWQVPRWRSHA